MGSAIPKQYLPICGKPVLAHTLEKALDWPGVLGVVAVTAPQDQRFSEVLASVAQPTSQLISQAPSRLSAVPVHQVDGGATRAESVSHGLRFIAQEAGDDCWVLVHDAARPLVSKHSVELLCERVWTSNSAGGLLAVPSIDTLKLKAGHRAGHKAGHRTGHRDNRQDDRVEKTLDRQHIWQAQTPQLFRAGALLKALDTAALSGSSIAANAAAASASHSMEITDEASAMEMAGADVIMVEGNAENIKITRAIDLTVAEALMTHQREDESAHE